MKTIYMIAWLFALASPLTAQMPSESMNADSLAADSIAPRWFVTPYAGAFLVDEGQLDQVGMTTDASALFGVRLGYRFHPHWAIEGSYGTASLDATSEGWGPVDGRLHIWHGDLMFLAPDSATARVALSAGAGGMRYSYDEFERRGVLLQDQSWAHELILSFGAGLLVDLGTHFGVRIEARDHVQFCKAEAEPIDETHDFSHCPLDNKVLNNPEFTGGAVIRF